MLQRSIAQAHLRPGPPRPRGEPAHLHRRRARDGAARRWSSGGERRRRRARRSGAAGADPDRDRDRLRGAGLRRRARQPGLRRASGPTTATSMRSDRLMILAPVVVPLLVPALTAAALPASRWRRHGCSACSASPGRCCTSGGRDRAARRSWSTDGPRPCRQAGGRRPFGITLVADLLAALMVAARRPHGAGDGGLRPRRHRRGARCASGSSRSSTCCSLGVCGAFLTGDLFNLYVWFEVMLMASFVLLALGGERPQMEGALKYVTLNLVSSALLPGRGRHPLRRRRAR